MASPIRLLRLSCIVCALVLAAVRVARAQGNPDAGVGDASPDAGPPGATAGGDAGAGRAAAEGKDGGPALVPPKLEHFVEADYPEPAREQEIEGGVVLELTIDARGQVTKAEVVRGLGHGLDEAAVEAAEQFEFEPATRNGEPIPAVIRYRYVFELDEQAEAPPEAAEQQRKDRKPRPGRLQGRVLALEDEQPLADTEIVLVSEQSSLTRRTVTGDDGSFRFAELPPGRYRVTVVAREYGQRTQVEEVRAGEVTELTYRLRIYEDGEQDGDGGPTFGATAYVEPPPREVVRRSIEREELTRIPGTRGDALRTVQLLPGVGRPPFGAGSLIVRGAAPDDSEVFFEGIPVPLLYHFGGLTSFINSDLLERIEFYPGNFSARYGRKVGGILEVDARDPATDGFHGMAKLDLVDASLLAEGPITENVSVAAAVRRSHIDAVFDKLVPSGAFDVLAAPVYWDYQAFLSWRPTDRDRVRAMVYGSSDRFRVLFSDPPDEDPAIRGNVDLSTQFHFGHLSWQRQLSDDVEQELTLQVGPSLLDFGLGETVEFEGDFVQMYSRAEWRARLNPHVRLIAGIDILFAPFKLDFRGPAPGQDEGNPNPMQPLASRETVDVEAEGRAFRPAAYVESDLRPIDSLRVVLGLRLDYYREIEEWSFDPRVVALYDVQDNTKLKLGAGIFSQPPDFDESSSELGNPELEPLHAVHLDMGVEHELERLGKGITVGAEAFYKHLWDRPVGTRGGLPPRFVNEGIGRIYGLEVSGRIKPVERRFFGFLSYTLSRSERKDGPNEPWRLFDFDQTHILSLSGLYRFNHGWELGATLQIVSGNPRTPIEGSVYDANNDVYIPISGKVNSERNPTFNRLDIRVAKKWDFDEWNLTLYLDVQNVYNAKNPEGRLYNYDFTESQSVRGLPIIPSLGVQGEM